MEVIVDTKKVIIFDSNPKNPLKKVEPKPKKKRVITHTSSWTTHFNSHDDFDVGVQKQHLLRLLSSKIDTEHNAETSIPLDSKLHFLREQIRQKLHGYKAQDIKKKIFSPATFITLEYILQLLSECDLSCFYCHEPVYLWYEVCREAKQWSVERIDNTLGHDVGNVVIACLSCNLKRRCMYHERYAFTKDLKIQKMGDSSQIS